MGRLTCVLVLGHGRPWRPPVLEDHRATALGYWWGWVWSGAWTLGVQNLPGAKVKVREPRWMVAPGGAEGGGCGRGPVCAFCRGGRGRRSGCPCPTPHPRGFPPLGFSGLPRWVGKGGGLWGGAQRAWSSPCRPIGWGGQGPRCLGRGPDRPPAPGAPCSAVPLPTFLAPPCLKAVKAQSASGVSVQVGGLQRRPRQPTNLGLLTPPPAPPPGPSGSVLCSLHPTPPSLDPAAPAGCQGGARAQPSPWVGGRSGLGGSSGLSPRPSPSPTIQAHPTEGALHTAAASPLSQHQSSVSGLLKPRISKFPYFPEPRYYSRVLRFILASSFP